jgi:hypothetical protein
MRDVSTLATTSVIGSLRGEGWGASDVDASTVNSAVPMSFMIDLRKWMLRWDSGETSKV